MKFLGLCIYWGADSPCFQLIWLILFADGILGGWDNIDYKKWNRYVGTYNYDLKISKIYIAN